MGRLATRLREPETLGNTMMLRRVLGGLCDQWSSHYRLFVTASRIMIFLGRQTRAKGNRKWNGSMMLTNTLHIWQV